MARRATTPNIPLSVEKLEDAAHELASVQAVLDLIFILDVTGDMESLCQGTFSQAIADAIEGIKRTREIIGSLYGMDAPDAINSTAGAGGAA